VKAFYLLQGLENFELVRVGWMGLEVGHGGPDVILYVVQVGQSYVNIGLAWPALAIKWFNKI
jgi:hypothetical protein